MKSEDFLKVATPEMIDVMNAEASRMVADLAALRTENARLREALQYLLEDYRVRLFAIGHTYEDIDNSVVVQEARAALA